MATITAAAGQRNQAAVHYHFGGREGLLSAIIDQHHQSLDEARFSRLAEPSGGDSVESLAAAIVEPMVAKLAHPSGRAFLRVQGEHLAAGVQPGQLAASMVEIGNRLVGLLPSAPAAWRSERARLAAVLVNARLAQEAMLEPDAGTDPEVLAATLTSAVVAVLTIAP